MSARGTRRWPASRSLAGEDDGPLPRGRGHEPGPTPGRSTLDFRIGGRDDDVVNDNGGNPVGGPGSGRGPKSEAHRRAIAASKVGERNPNWKGDAVDAKAARDRARMVIPVLERCTDCPAPATDRHHEDGNTRNNHPSNVIPLCRRCHMKRDGRLDTFVVVNVGRPSPRQGLRQPIRHGTMAGYRAHRRHGVPACDECKSARRSYRRERGQE